MIICLCGGLRYLFFGFCHLLPGRDASAVRTYLIYAVIILHSAVITADIYLHEIHRAFLQSVNPGETKFTSYIVV